MTVLVFFNLFRDVEVGFLTVSLTDYKNFKLNCGSVIEILINRVEYVDKNLRMNSAVCYNNAVLKVFNTFLSLIVITISFIFGIRYYKRLSLREDITDILSLLKKRNKQ